MPIFATILFNEDMNSITSTFYVVGVSYKKADANTRGKFSVSPENQQKLILEAIKNGIDGFMVLSTCNRTEVIGFAQHPYKLIQLLGEFWQEGSVEEFAKYSYVLKSKEAVNHLFRMATGLDSQILGDYEIVGQLKESFHNSKELGAINMFMERLFSNILQASKRVKNETTLSSGTTSVAYAATQYLNSNFPQLESESILVYGLGEIGQHTLQNLLTYTPCKNISVINRSVLSLDIPELEKTKVYTHSQLVEAIEDTSILVVATGATAPTILPEHISASKKVTILDLSMPSNVSEKVTQNKEVTLVGIDVLSKITDSTIENREKQVPFAEKIIKESTKEFNSWLNHRKLTPAINSIKDTLEQLRINEINLQKVNGNDYSPEQVEKITSRMVQKITTQFAKHLRANADDANKSIDLMYEVFNIEPSHESGL